MPSVILPARICVSAGASSPAASSTVGSIVKTNVEAAFAYVKSSSKLAGSVAPSTISNLPVETGLPSTIIHPS